MERLLVWCLAGCLIGGASAWAFAGEADSSSLGVVEGYLNLLNEGRFHDVVEVYAPDAVLAEFDLDWQIHQGHALHERLRALIADGVRVEAEVAWVSEDGTLVVAVERLWSDDATAGTSPLHSTTTYLVDGQRLLSVTRVLAAGQRDARMREALVGIWASAQYRMAVTADGTFRSALRVEDLGLAPGDRGTVSIANGVLTMVSDDATSICRAGDTATWNVHFRDPDTFQLVLMDETCPHGRRGRHAGYTRTWLRLAD